MTMLLHFMAVCCAFQSASGAVPGAHSVSFAVPGSPLCPNPSTMR